MVAMGRLVVLARHATAESGEGGSDHERALTDNGQRVASAAGRWLSTFLPTPDLVWCSSALRARQTWEAMAHSLRPLEVRIERELYLASPADVVAGVQAAGERTIVVVGHNPTVEQSLAQLSGRLRGMTAGAVAVVDAEAGALVDFWEPPR